MNQLPKSPHNQLPNESDPTDVYKSQLFEAVAAQPGVITKELPDPYFVTELHSSRVQDPRISFLDARSHTTSLAPEVVERGKDVITQELQAVIKAGGELFAVIEANATNFDPEHRSWYHAYLVTRLGGEGQPASLVGVISGHGSTLRVGRSDKNGYTKATSRAHFTVTQGPINGLIITDTDSLNHTKVAYRLGDSEAAAAQSPASVNARTVSANGLKSLVGRRRAAQSAANPLEDTRIWSLNPHDARQAIKQSADTKSRKAAVQPRTAQ